MRRVCEVCDESYNDEFHSTICPHQGIGFCRKCDCVVCVCDPWLSIVDSPPDPRHAGRDPTVELRNNLGEVGLAAVRWDLGIDQQALFVILESISGNIIEWRWKR